MNFNTEINLAHLKSTDKIGDIVRALAVKVTEQEAIINNMRGVVILLSIANMCLFALLLFFTF
jgi:hypothetical protein